MLRVVPSPGFSCETCAVRDKALCVALSDEERRPFRAICTPVTIPAKQTVFREGEANDYLFTVLKGAVRLSKLLPDGRRQITGLRFPGDFLGLPVAARYITTAEALIETTFCRIARTQLVRLLDGTPKLERRLLELASHEIAQAQDQFVLLGCKTVTERLASLFVRLLAQIGRQEGSTHLLELPMRREDLADYVGRTRESVIRSLQALRKSGVIETPSPRLIVILDLERLKALTGDNCAPEREAGPAGGQAQNIA